MAGGYQYTKPRGPIAAMYSSPGPCYGLPGLIGHNTHDPRSVHNKYPAWQFGIKHGKIVLDSSPGPVHHPDPAINRTGKNGAAHYSLYGRPRDPKSFQNPGAGTYSPEKAGPSANPHAPQYSFGSRTKNRSSDQNPAPNVYDLPQMTGKTNQSDKKQAPIYSLTGRSNIGSFHEDLQRTPGPGAYSSIDPNTYKNNAPNYSLRSRCAMPGDGTQKPGPGSHSPEKVYVNKRQFPSHSFGIRHTDYSCPLIVDVQD